MAFGVDTVSPFEAVGLRDGRHQPDRGIPPRGLGASPELREPLELVPGAAVGAALAGYLLGRGAGIAVGGVLVTVFAATIVSRAYSTVAGRENWE